MLLNRSHKNHNKINFDKKIIILVVFSASGCYYFHLQYYLIQQNSNNLFVRFEKGLPRIQFIAPADVGLISRSLINATSLANRVAVLL